MSEDNKNVIRSRQVNFRVTKKEKEVLESIAKRFGVRDVSEYVRRTAIYDYPKLYKNLEQLHEIGKKLDDLNNSLEKREKSIHEKLLERGYFPYDITASKIEGIEGILIPDAFFQKPRHIPTIIKLLENEVNECVKGYVIIPIEFVPELIAKKSKDVKYAIYVKR